MRRPWALYAALFAIGFVVYGLFAWDRIGRQSGSPHFVYQADAWLRGDLAIRPSCGPCGPDLACDPEPPACTSGPPLPHDDWAFVETVVLRDGTLARGRRLYTRKAFRTLGGGELPIEDVASSRGFTALVSFPPVPSLIMLPGALVSGRGANDVVPTLVVAALILPLSLAAGRLLAGRRVRGRGLACGLRRDANREQSSGGGEDRESRCVRRMGAHHRTSKSTHCDACRSWPLPDCGATLTCSV